MAERTVDGNTTMLVFPAGAVDNTSALRHTLSTLHHKQRQAPTQPDFTTGAAPGLPNAALGKKTPGLIKRVCGGRSREVELRIQTRHLPAPPTTWWFALGFSTCTPPKCPNASCFYTSAAFDCPTQEPHTCGLLEGVQRVEQGGGGEDPRAPPPAPPATWWPSPASSHAHRRHVTAWPSGAPMTLTPQ